MNLTELQLNQDAYIVSINESPTTNQLYEIGVLPGSKIKLMFKSDLVNPVFKVDDVFISIDEKLLSLIEVRLSKS